MSGPTKAQVVIDLHDARQAITVLTRERDEARAEIAVLGRRIDALAADRDRVVHEREQIRQERSNAQAAVDVWQRATTEARAGWAAAQDIVNEHHRAAVNLRRELDEATDHLNRRIAANAELQQRLDSEQAAYRERQDEWRTLAIAHDVQGRRLAELVRELARTVQTSHDREAALIDAIAAVARPGHPDREDRP